MNTITSIMMTKGFIVLEHGTQSFLNDMCNDVMDSDSIQPIQGQNEQETNC